jgi:hypothetical protein
MPSMDQLHVRTIMRKGMEGIVVARPKKIQSSKSVPHAWESFSVTLNLCIHGCGHIA